MKGLWGHRERAPRGHHDEDAARTEGTTTTPRLSEQPMTGWLMCCPSFDQGLVRPVMTESGQVVLMCDEGSEVWLDPSQVSEKSWIDAEPTTWRVSDGVHIAPRTTRWARRDELPESWGAPAWNEG